MLAAVIFDLDDTLAPDTTTQYLRRRGVDVRRFWDRAQARMAQGWDQVPAYLAELQVSSRRHKQPFSAASMAQAAATMRVYPGVDRLFVGLLEQGAKLGLTLEFYLISSGLRSIVEHLPISAAFTGIWCTDLVFDATGGPAFPKNIVSFTDKTRPLIEISKGFSRAATLKDPFLVNTRIAAGNYRIPFSRTIFVGDGLTDVPCFSMVSARGGFALAVYDPKRAGGNLRGQRFLADARVQAVVEADYRPSGPAFAALCDGLAAVAASPADG